MKRGEIEIFYEGELVTRKEAVAQGLKRYFTGHPCKNNHVAERITNSGRCCECNRLSTKAWRELSKNKGNSKDYSTYKVLPDLDILESWLRYDSDNGDLYWSKRPLKDFTSERSCKTWNTKFSGKVAGSRNHSNGYIEVRLPDKKLYKAHRLAWKLYYKEEPVEIIDHRNGKGYDNRINNLRQASYRDNSRNMKVVGDIPYKGVQLISTGVYLAAVHVNDERIALGEYLTPAAAARAYDSYAKQVFGEFANLNFPEEE